MNCGGRSGLFLGRTFRVAKAIENIKNARSRLRFLNFSPFLTRIKPKAFREVDLNNIYSF